MARNRRNGMMESVPLTFLTVYSKIRFVVSYMGEALEQGIILVADNDQKAAKFLEEFRLTFNNVIEYQNWNSRSKSPCNFCTGIMLLKNQKMENVQSFLMAKDFLPVVVTGGILPDVFRTNCYILRIDDKTLDMLRNPAMCKVLIEAGNRYTEEIDTLLAEIDKIKSRIEKSNFSEELETLHFCCVLCGTLFWKELIQKFPVDACNRAWELYMRDTKNLLETMDDYAGGIDVAESIVQAMCDYVKNVRNNVKIIDKDNITIEDEQHIEQEKCILTDDVYYYIPQRLFGMMCKETLGILSICELKKMAQEVGILDTDNSSDYTCKITIITENGKKRIRVLKLSKELFYEKEEGGLEGIYERQKSIKWHKPIIRVYHAQKKVNERKTEED